MILDILFALAIILIISLGLMTYFWYIKPYEQLITEYNDNIDFFENIIKNKDATIKELQEKTKKKKIIKAVKKKTPILQKYTFTGGK